jgi:hypothetical protein
LSNGPHIEIIGDDELQRALTDAPETMADALDVASDQAAGILDETISAVTNVDTGLLRSQGQLIPGPGFRVTYANFTPYSVYVDARYQFVARGVERGERPVERVYERAVDQAADEIENDRA